MPAAMFISMFVIGGLIALFSWLLYSEDGYPSQCITGIISTTIVLFSAIWFTIASNQPWKPIITDYHEIKEVVFPDGTRSQMFSCDGLQLNATQLFSKIIDTDKWQAKRIKYEASYCGIDFSYYDKVAKDSYFLVPKDEVKDGINLTKKSVEKEADHE